MVRRAPPSRARGEERPCGKPRSVARAKPSRQRQKKPAYFGQREATIQNRARCDNVFVHAFPTPRKILSLVTKLSQEKPRETTSCFRSLRLPVQKAGRVFTSISKELVKACQDLQQWANDTNTPHRSETNGIPERAVRRVKEGTATAMIQSGLPDAKWDCAMECFGAKRQPQTHLFERRVTAASIWQEDASWKIHGICIACLRRLVK